MEWQVSRRGILGFFFCNIFGLFHATFKGFSPMEKWELMGIVIDSPLWIMVPYFIMGTLYFVWAGWYFPLQARQKHQEYRSTFSQPGEL